MAAPYTISFLLALPHWKPSAMAMDDRVILVNATKILRVARWTLWFVVTLVTSTFAVLCFVTACLLNRLSKESDVDANELRSFVIAPFFMGSVVLCFIVVSFILSLRLSKMKQYWGSLDAALVASFFQMVLITLLFVLVMHGFKSKLTENESSYESRYYYYFSHRHYDTGEDCYRRYHYSGYTHGDWNDNTTHTFTATFVMGYVSAAMYLFHVVAYGYFMLLCREHPKTRGQEANEALLDDV